MKITKKQLKKLIENFLFENQLNSTESVKNAKYTVVKGDTLVSIAKKFGITNGLSHGEPWEYIAWANNFDKNAANNLEPGQIITIPSIRVHKVDKGDNLIKIAFQYGIASSLSDKEAGKLLQNANNLTSDVLNVDQILLIPSKEVIDKKNKDRKKASEIAGVSENLINWMKHEEGGRNGDKRAGIGQPYTKAYNDGTGVWTIGFGHTNRVGTNPTVINKNLTKTEAECDLILRNDLNQFSEEVKRRYKDVKLLQREFDAIVSLFFNQGGGGTNNRIGNDLTSGTFVDYNDNFKMHFTGTPATARGVRLGGLSGRREREWDIFTTGKYISKHTGENLANN